MNPKRGMSPERKAKLRETSETIRGLLEWRRETRHHEMLLVEALSVVDLLVETLDALDATEKDRDKWMRFAFFAAKGEYPRKRRK